MAFGVMSRTYGCDRTGIASFIGNNDAASYLVGYEGRRAYVLICNLGWLNIGCDGVRMSYGYIMLLC